MASILDINENINTDIPYEIFNENQLILIERGKREKLDISWYANPKFSAWQMEEIMIGLLRKVDVSQYAKPEYDSYQMSELRKALEEGFDISDMLDPEIEWGLMRMIRDSKAYSREHKKENV